MDDVELAILKAWGWVGPRLAQDERELARRLARRRMKLLRRVPREWCLGVRASDTRIAAELGLEVERRRDPERRQEIRFTAPLLRKLCALVKIEPPGQPLADVARLLGTNTGMIASRFNGRVFRTHHIKGLCGSRGWPVPMLYTDRLLDPSRKLFVLPDEAWSWTCSFLLNRIPADLDATVTRVPYYHSHVPARMYDLDRHPEVDGLAERDHVPRPLPRMGPDVMAWYKWKGDEYIGYDWRRAERNPRIREEYERQQRVAERRRQKYRENRATRGPRPTHPDRGSIGSIHFNGWLWRCPVCERTCRIIYFPLQRMNLLRGLRHIAAMPRLAEIVDIPPLVSSDAPGGGFACARCHQITYLNRKWESAWNTLVSYLTDGLLYGSEVDRPEWFDPPGCRRRPRGPRPFSERRTEVIELLMQGLSFRQIAQRLGVAKGTVEAHVVKTYRRYGVKSRGELAARLGRVIGDGAPAGGAPAGELLASVAPASS